MTQHQDPRQEVAVRRKAHKSILLKAQRAVLALGSGVFIAWLLLVIFLHPDWRWHCAFMWVWVVPLALSLLMMPIRPKGEGTSRRSLFLVSLEVVEAYVYLPLRIVSLACRLVWRVGRITGRFTSPVTSRLGGEAGILDFLVVLALAGCWIAALVPMPLPARIAAISLTVALTETLVLRLLVWAFHPVRPLVNAFEFVRIFAIAFAAIGKALVVLGREDKGSDQFRLGQKLVRAAESLVSRVPSTEGAFLCILISFWLGASVLVINSFAIAAYALRALGLPIYVTSAATGSAFVDSLVSSLAVFSTAPIASIDPTGRAGVVLVALEISNAALLTLLFLALFLRAMSREGEGELEVLRKKQVEFTGLLDEMEDHFTKRMGKRREARMQRTEGSSELPEVCTDDGSEPQGTPSSENE